MVNMMKMKIKVNDIVRIKGAPEGDINEFAKVKSVLEDGVWISNLNQPFSGTISDIVPFEMVEKV
jgi:glycine cleavage system H lipoate-binding protein